MGFGASLALLVAIFSFPMVATWVNLAHSSLSPPAEAVAYSTLTGQPLCSASLSLARWANLLRNIAGMMVLFLLDLPASALPIFLVARHQVQLQCLAKSPLTHQRVSPPLLSSGSSAHRGFGNVPVDVCPSLHAADAASAVPPAVVLVLFPSLPLNF